MRPPFAPALIRRSALAVAGAAAAAALAAPTPAAAAESAMPTAQAKAYGMDWVPYIDPANLPPVEQRKVICLVDSGVEVNPDLPADRPEGPIVMRTSVDNGSGLPGDKPEHAHGTSMASMAGALAGNDWGTVGAWPGGRIISMRALSYDRTTFAAGDWRRGVQECIAPRIGELPVVAINLSLGSTRAISARERALLEDQIAEARNMGITVLAAAGNSGGVLETPANIAGVVPVAAGSATDGALCSYAAYEADVFVGPACGINISWQGMPARTDGGGSSAATAFASA